ncbi:HAMP domain-containing sensor histidine kinase [Planotetraspora phitsanulokensis]|uniref:histidine kinase n=1 Tax=Planotetraspora phitsanulokensis TaxID=575192 RepID=A0A8J3XGQ7_9ACTN|nr:HAMP domain-containing sensor histidine kinase [Planotetraspora phitsanulokensis]GII39261.1 two-component sensor histidine kinase [Planotetraspora phitsanulokensis]
MFRPRSIRTRYTMMATALSLVFLTTIGVSVDLTTRYRIEAHAFEETKDVASQWSAAVRNGKVPHTLPTMTRVDLIQIVDANGHVLQASKQAWNRPPISRVRPPADDRFQDLTSCEPGRDCVLLWAIRVTPAEDSPVVYAGLPEPFLLATHWLELGLALIALPILGFVAWATWALVGRTLRPVETIRARMSEITGTDVSLRVPLPPGRDEIAMLARTANQTLDRLEIAVKQQRRFASDASHELRTPIAGLRVALEDAIAHPEDVDAQETLRTALSTTNRLEAIVGDLLVLARLRASDPEPPEPIDLAALAKEASTGPIDTVPVHVSATGDVRVSGSRIQLMRVMDNLLNNARRHADSSVEVTVESENGQAVLSVTDDGAGIAPQDRERVFGRFTRLDEARRRDPGGTGLGLAICREIVEAHGGTLRVEDSPRGARFVLRLRAMADNPRSRSRP